MKILIDILYFGILANFNTNRKAMTNENLYFDNDLRNFIGQRILILITNSEHYKRIK